MEAGAQAQDLANDWCTCRSHYVLLPEMLLARGRTRYYAKQQETLSWINMILISECCNINRESLQNSNFLKTKELKLNSTEKDLECIMTYAYNRL